MILHLIIIFLVGIIAGFINVNAGGGSLLTMPMLIFMGLPSAVANGTNRIAILAGALTATTSFKKKGFFDWKFGLQLSVPALIGAVIGSSIVITIPDKVFNLLLSFVMVMVLFIIIYKPYERLKHGEGYLSKGKKLLCMFAFFFVGFYGGFIQAGVGFVTIATLTLITGLSLVKINSLKVFVIGIYTIFSLSIFIINGKINLPLGISLAAGNVIGAWTGSHFAVKKGDKWIRVILIIMVLVMAVKLSGVWRMFF